MEFYRSLTNIEELSAMVLVCSETNKATSSPSHHAEQILTIPSYQMKGQGF
jgi:hypothetical protein